jgi:hypothetical protein
MRAFATLFLSTVVFAGRKLSISLAADNAWTLDITGNPTIIGPTDAATKNGMAWSSIVTVEKELTGKGPWVVGVKAKDFGVIAAFFASVTVDRVPFTNTGGKDTKWTVTNQKQNMDDWLLTSFDDSKWVSNYASTKDCLSNEAIWTVGGVSLISDFKAKTSQEVHGVWYPSCQSVNTDNYYRLVIPPKKCAKAKENNDKKSRGYEGEDECL